MNQNSETEIDINTKANREYKDSVFSLLFSGIALKLYCAVTGKPYDPNAKVDITTLTDALIRGRLNDLAFILDGRLVVLIEHQSSINENMALRMLSYIARIYEKYIDQVYGKGAIYREKKLIIPRPEFIVLYNGIKELPNDEDRYTMRLSDMFAKLSPSDEPFMGGLDLTVEMFNINKGRNPEMAARCRELDEYETFIQKIRDNEAAGMSLKDAIEKAVAECVEEGVLVNFLKNHKWEVENMLTKEWDFDEELAVREMETREEVSKNFARALLKRGGMTVDEIVSLTGLDLNTVLHLQGE